jgi:site-specific recombinase XerC
MLVRYARWLEETKGRWFEPDLAAYRDSLLEKIKPVSARAYVSTVRGRYRRILKDNSLRDTLFQVAGERLAELGMDDTLTNRKAVVDEIITRIDNAISPEHSQVKVTKVQDKPDEETGFRLNPVQVDALRNQMQGNDLSTLRNRGIIAILLGTGIREQELCDLSVKDLHQTYGGLPAVHVRHGKNDKERMVVLGENLWCIAVVEKWLDAAGIKEGPVFRGVFKGNKMLRPGRLTTRGIRLIMSQFSLDGRQIRAHDLRKTYAKAFYDATKNIVALAQNLGHTGNSIKTTMAYIGNLNAEDRASEALYNPWI